MGFSKGTHARSKLLALVQIRQQPFNHFRGRMMRRGNPAMAACGMVVGHAGAGGLLHDGGPPAAYEWRTGRAPSSLAPDGRNAHQPRRGGLPPIQKARRWRGGKNAGRVHRRAPCGPWGPDRPKQGGDFGGANSPILA